MSFMVPFEVLEPMMGTHQVWNSYSTTEEQLSLQANSLRKVQNRIRAIEKAEMVRRQIELEGQLGALQV
jgi:hypothetical protein